MVGDAERLAFTFRERIEKLAETINLPDIDIPALAERQRKTIDAMSRAAQMSKETAAEVSKRQLEIMRAGAEHLASMLQDLKLSAEQQRALATKTFESALTSANEFAEMTSTSNNEAFELVKQGMTDNFEEIRKRWKG